MAIPDAPTNTLAGFVLGRFTDWKQNRQSLEDRWNKNLNAFKNISDGIWKKGEGEDWRSNTFIGKTKQKCIAAYSLIVNMLLRDGKIPFILVKSDDTVDDGEQEYQEDDYAKRMQRRIDRQFSLTKADEVIMKNILCAVVLGETYQKKGITTIKRKSYSEISPVQGMTDPSMPNSQAFELIEENTEYPCLDYVSPYNIYRDLETDDVKNSSGIIHHDYVSPFDLRSKSEIEYFDKEAIERVIKSYSGAVESSSEAPPSPAMKEVSKRRKTIPYYEYWGRVSKKLIEDYENEKNKGSVQPDANAYENDGYEVECLVCVAGNEVVRYFRTGDPSERPFERCVLLEDLEGLGGLGIPDSTNDKQLLLNGAARAFEDNKKLSGNVIIATKDRLIEGELGAVSPGLRIRLSEECKDAREAIQAVNIPDVGASLLELIQVAERWIDEDSNIPRISQGVQVNNSATAYETSKLVESSGKFIAGIFHNFDKGLIKPDAEYYYHYNMMDAKCPIKGNFSVRPTGYIEYQNSYEKIQALNQIFGVIQTVAILMKNPETQSILKVRNIIEQACRATRNIDPDEFIITEKEKQLFAQSPEGKAQAQAVQVSDQQKQELFELEKQKALAEINKLNAQAQLATVEAEVIKTTGKTKVVETLGKLRNQKEQLRIQAKDSEQPPVE